MKLIVALGNPGIKYTYTRHNIGFLVLDAYLKDVLWSKDHNSLVYKNNNIIYCKPQTYMNLSGLAVSSIKNYFKIETNEILVIYDELHLPEGTFRFGINKSSGGHNGIKDIIEKLGTKNFLTLRIGIGPREKANSISNYVMENINKSSLETLSSLFPIIFESLKSFESGSTISELQNKYNK